MPSTAGAGSYTATAIALHWLIALAIAGTFSLGLHMHDLPLSPTKLRLYSYHKWAGVTIFLLALLRLAWRASHSPPPLPGHLPQWQRIAAQATHHLLYLLIIVIPLTGWLMSSAKGFQTVWFGVLPLPDLLDKNKELGDALALVHMSLNLSMAALVIAHVGAAIKHQVIDRDEVLGRMLPFLNNSKVPR